MPELPRTKRAIVAIAFLVGFVCGAVVCSLWWQVSVVEGLAKLAPFAWPAVALCALVYLRPAISHLLQQRDFTVEVGDKKITVQGATEQIRQQIEDLQGKVSDLLQTSPSAAPLAEESARLAAPPPTIAKPRLLWVDDHPSNNAFEMARLRAEGFAIVEVASTDEALRKLSEEGTAGFGAVITDLNRREGGINQPMAGLSLVELMRKRRIDLLVVLYTSQGRVTESLTDTVARLGNVRVTASPVDLLLILQKHFKLNWRV